MTTNTERKGKVTMTPNTITTTFNTAAVKNEGFRELTAEEMADVQGGIFWIGFAFGAVSALGYGTGVYAVAKNTDFFDAVSYSQYL